VAHATDLTVSVASTNPVQYNLIAAVTKAATAASDIVKSPRGAIHYRPSTHNTRLSAARGVPSSKPLYSSSELYDVRFDAVCVVYCIMGRETYTAFLGGFNPGCSALLDFVFL